MLSLEVAVNTPDRPDASTLAAVDAPNVTAFEPLILTVVAPVPEPVPVITRPVVCAAVEFVIFKVVMVS